MSTLYIILVIAAAIAPLSPLIVRLFASIGLDVDQKQFDLLKKIVEDAVSHVNQVSLNKDMTSEEKKALAITVAKDLSSKFGIKKLLLENITDLIESAVWSEEDASDDDEDDDGLI